MNIKMDSKTIKVLVNFIKYQEGWDLQELVNDTLFETGMLKVDSIKYPLSADECGVDFDNEHVCMLNDLINDYTFKLLNGMCNVLESFKDEECYLYIDD